MEYIKGSERTLLTCRCAWMLLRARWLPSHCCAGRLYRDSVESTLLVHLSDIHFGSINKDGRRIAACRLLFYVGYIVSSVISNRQQTINIRREINSDDFRTLIEYDIQKARILMRKSIVILPHRTCGNPAFAEACG